MKTIFAALILLFPAVNLYSQTTTHPKLVPVYQTINQVNMSTGATKQSARVAGYQYGDRFIKNNRQSRKELTKIIKLEPLAYQQCKRARICGIIGTPLLIGGFAAAIFGFKYVFGDNPTKVPLIAGITVGVTGLVLKAVSQKLSIKSIETFNAHATADTENTTDGNFGFMFGINYNPVMHKPYPALILNF